MHVLTVTTLWPNREQIRNGVFVRERLRKLVAATPGLRVTVVAPVPWFPLRGQRFGRYGAYARVPHEERDGDVRVLHPRYLQIPRIGELLAPIAYYWSVRRCLQRQHMNDVDLVDAHFAFPDGAAGVMLARALGKPASITVRGSDVNIIAGERIAGRWIRWALGGCDQVIAVSEALADRVRGLIERAGATGAQRPPVTVIRNGVDFERFRPHDDVAGMRRDLGLDGRVVVSVGNLIPLKGHDLVIRAVAELPDATLCIVGDGPERARLTALADELGVADRVRFCGEMKQPELVRYYNAADVTVLASSHEGLPNVILESMACGTPVVATPVGGVPEVMTDPRMGILLTERSPEAIRDALKAIPPGSACRAAGVRDSIRTFDWRRTVAALQRSFSALTGERLVCSGEER